MRKKSNFWTSTRETCAKSPTRSHPKTNYTQNEQAKQQAKETEELKKEIAQLKLDQNDKLRNKKAKTNDKNDHSKNLQEASNNGGQKQSNIKTEVLEVMNFIQQTMANLQNYIKQLKHHLNKDTTQMSAW